MRFTVVNRRLDSALFDMGVTTEAIPEDETSTIIPSTGNSHVSNGVNLIGNDRVEYGMKRVQSQPVLTRRENSIRHTSTDNLLLLVVGRMNRRPLSPTPSLPFPMKFSCGRNRGDSSPTQQFSSFYNSPSLTSQVSFFRSISTQNIDKKRPRSASFSGVSSSSSKEASRQRYGEQFQKEGVARSRSLRVSRKGDTFPTRIRNSSSTQLQAMTVVGTSGYQSKYVESVARYGRQFSARQRNRLIDKDGDCKISRRHVHERNRSYLADIFTTLVDMKWRYNIIMFVLSFVLTWVFFAFVWWIIAVTHDDDDHAGEVDWKPCVYETYDFATAFLFSVETQATIGYGSRHMESTCPQAFLALMAQCCIGVLIQSLITGVIFAKLSRAKSRAHTLMFSRQAVICQQDDKYCFIFRIADMRKSLIISTTVRLLLVKNRLTKEGEAIKLCQYPMKLESGAKTDDPFVFLAWPATAVHVIDEDSPLWDISAEQLFTERFEIIVILEGIVESTGMTTQVRTSYLPSEILWAHRLFPLVACQKDNGQYIVDYSHFHDVMPVDMPECSARCMDELATHIHADPSCLATNHQHTTQTQ